MANTQPARSVKEIEADIAATRSRLARTVDELTYRVSPETIKANTVASIKGKVESATLDADGNPRYDRLATALGGVAAVALALGGLRRVFYRG
ncbi:hypothetical protein AVL62_04855 [Serinicoccus chungangensis]|uniref:DUF3618 domain-containing protein n=1 Tax=Serinicoccus chungangensis TaxID=767452 RepID=A0A0W8I8B4_9MICO|nr:DUF3618 domain-containing protein [Serinicoccus chungangensis]KUG55641.1 hypothetical protein AVL62_04855 [Serinicoccus chungangensis]